MTNKSLSLEIFLPQDFNDCGRKYPNEIALLQKSLLLRGVLLRQCSRILVIAWSIFCDKAIQSLTLLSIKLRNLSDHVNVVTS